MAVEVEKLKVTMEANFGQYQRDLEKVRAQTDRKLSQVEKKLRTTAASAGVSLDAIPGAASPVVAASNRMAMGMSAVGKAALETQIINERLVSGMSRFGGTLNQVQGPLASSAAALAATSSASGMLASNWSRLQTQGNGMAAMFGGIGAALAVASITEYANAWTRVTRSLDANSQIFGVALTSAANLNALANEARVDLDAYAKLYVRTSAAIRDYGFEAGTAEKVTSTLAKALKLGGATAGEQASVMLQFSQALAKGKLDGDEFRSVMENATVVQELTFQAPPGHKRRSYRDGGGRKAAHSRPRGGDGGWCWPRR